MRKGYEDRFCPQSFIIQNVLPEAPYPGTSIDNPYVYRIV
jgi:hypothetical protein